MSMLNVGRKLTVVRFVHCTIRQLVFDCKYLSCKICFNVFNYVFILFTFNLYRLVNFNHLATILAVVTDNTSKMS